LARTARAERPVEPLELCAASTRSVEWMGFGDAHAHADALPSVGRSPGLEPFRLSARLGPIYMGTAPSAGGHDLQFQRQRQLQHDHLQSQQFQPTTSTTFPNVPPATTTTHSPTKLYGSCPHANHAPCSPRLRGHATGCLRPSSLPCRTPTFAKAADDWGVPWGKSVLGSDERGDGGDGRSAFACPPRTHTARTRRDHGAFPKWKGQEGQVGAKA